MNILYKIINVIVIIVVQVCFVRAAFATIYHVSTAGADNPSNGSQASPWRTLAYASTHVAASSGNIIQLDAGTYIETSYVVVPAGVSIQGAGIDQTILRAAASLYYTYAPSNGYALNHFLIQMISTSQIDGNQRISDLTIDGDGKQLHGGIIVNNRNIVTITNVKVQYTGFTAIWLWGTDASEISNSTLTDASFGNTTFQTGNLNLGDVSNTNLFGLTIHSYPYNTGNSWGYGVKAIGPDNGMLSNVKFYNSTIDVSKTGTFINSKTSLPLANISIEYHNTAIQNCEIRNTIVNGNISIVQDSPPAGATPVIRIYNSTFNLGPDSGSAERGYGLELSVNNAEIDHNYFNQGSYAIGHFLAKRAGWKIHNNVFENQRDTYPAGTIHLEYGDGVGGLDNLEYYNNTIITDGSALNEAGTLTSIDVISVKGITSENTPCTNWKIKNNIFKRTNPQETYMYRGPTLIYLELATLSNSEISYNLFDQFPVGAVSGVAYSSNLTGDAGFSLNGSKPSPYFTLNSNSAAVDAGTNVGFMFSGAAPDMGAYETAGTTMGSLIDFGTQSSGIGSMNPTVYTNVDGNGTSATFVNINRYDGTDASPVFADRTPAGSNEMGAIQTSSATITFSAPVKVPSFFVNTLVYGGNTGWSVVGSLNGTPKFTFNYNYSFPYATWGEVVSGSNVIVDKLTWTNAQNTGIDDITIQPSGLADPGSLIDFGTQGPGIGSMSPTVYTNVDGNGTTATFVNINRYDGSDADPVIADNTPAGSNRMGIIQAGSATITFSAPVKVPSFFANTLVYGANTGWSVVGSLNGVAQFTFDYNYSFTYGTWGEVTAGNGIVVDKLTWTNAQNSGIDDIAIQPGDS
jgi:hypothetical protein